MAGIESLKKVQLGLETTAGTEVNATTVWRGTGNIRDDRNLVFVDENIGLFSGSDRTYVSSYMSTLILDDTPASYQQLGYLLCMGVEADTAGTQDGTGSDYVYTHPIASTAAPTVVTYTVEAGDNQQEEQFVYGFCQDFSLSGSGGEALTVSGNLVGRETTTGTFTGSVAVPTVESVLFSKGKLYLDASGGTAGTTQVSNTLLDATLNYTTNIRPKYTADGSLDFSFHQPTMPEITLDVTFEHNGSAVTEIANARAETVRILRLLFEGSAFTTAGTTYSNHTLIIDLVGKWEIFSELGAADGNSTVSGTFRQKPNSTDGAGQFIVVNELSALT